MTSETQQLISTACDNAERIIEHLKPAWASLQNMASHAYELYVHQQVNCGISNVVTGAIFLIISIILFLVAYELYKNYKKAEEDVHRSDDSSVVFCVIFGLMAFFFFAIITTSGILRLSNPEYYAIKELLSNLPK
jgi:hypothetical protein